MKIIYIEPPAYCKNHPWALKIQYDVGIFNLLPLNVKIIIQKEIS